MSNLSDDYHWRTLDDAVPSEAWITSCATRLRHQWPRVSSSEATKLATSISQDMRVNNLRPHDAAEIWIELMTQHPGNADFQRL